MTTLTTPAPGAAPPMTLQWLLSDVATVTKRNLTHWFRQPQLLLFSTVQPVMLVLLFNYVFGGALQTGVENYTNFLLPGIFVQVVAFGASQTAVGLAEDLAGGVIDRFRSLPMARSAVLAGRTLSDLVRNAFVVLLMTGVGYIIGFRFQAGIGPAVGAVLMVTLFGYAISWVFAFVGLAVKGAETAQAAGFVVMFPLVFASSAFVPTQTMPAALRAFADASPVTNVVNAVRAMVLGLPTAEPLLYALLWIAGILAVFVPLSVSRYRRAA